MVHDTTIHPFEANAILCFFVSCPNRFYTVTYNVATKSPRQPLEDLLQWNGRTEQQLPDFCLFG